MSTMSGFIIFEIAVAVIWGVQAAMVLPMLLFLIAIIE